MPDTNQHSYTEEKVVKNYLRAPYLLKAENILLNKYSNELTNAQFLDIGIGGGRTTFFIKDMVKSYIGVDYSNEFVSVVNKKYLDEQKVKIEWGDARNLNQFKAETFDFILFSFNGIDCVSFEDRQEVLKECIRLLKPGGHFFFSFHNAFSLRKLYSFQWPKNPFNYLPEWKRVKMLKSLNGPITKYEGKNYFSLYDGADYFKTEVLYIKPDLQNELLVTTGFRNIEYFNATSGKKMGKQDYTNTNCDWIYVDCQK